MRAGWLPAILFGVFAAGSAARADDVQADRARDDYLLHCMGCHGEKGKGLTGKVPSFPADLGRLLSTPRGREFIQRVPGVSQSALPSDRLAAVLNWLITEYTDSATASRIKPFTPEEIERMRHQPLLDVASSRTDL